MADTGAASHRGRTSPSTEEHPELAALRERGAHRSDPVRFRLVQAFARRAGAHQGAARQVLESRLAALVETVGHDDAPRPPMLTAADAAQPQRSQRRPSALAALLDHIAQQTSSRPNHAPATSLSTSPPAASPTEATTTLQFFQRTWSRLNAAQRLAQSASSLPQNAGPLNSQHLVHRSLTLMHQLSPAYLEQLVSYLDALLWLEQTTARDMAHEAAPARALGGKKSGSGRRG